MKTRTAAPKESKQGFILFLVMGIISVITLASLIALTSARLEARTSRNNYHSVRALYHAEAGVKLVKMEVERRLEAGESLSTILSSLSVSPPQGITFETINTFKIIVPDRLFSFESVGTSNEARASVVVQYRRHPVITIGLFGDISFGAQNHTSLYGYDSRLISDPVPTDNNGGASIGSNGSITLGNNNFTFDGSILLGETGDGLVASCTRCDSYTKAEIGMVDPDPMGLTTGGSLAQTFASKVISNDNDDSNGVIVNNVVYIDNSIPRTLPAGDYYVTSWYMAPNSTLNLDNEDGPIRIFLDGPFEIKKSSANDIKNLVNESASPLSFQIFSKSTQDIKLYPRTTLKAFIYAPLAAVDLQPQGNFMGNVWSDRINIQPGGEIFVDTSIADEMMLNNLEIHAWYEQQGM